MKIGIDIRLWSETGVGRYIRNLVENIFLIDSKNQYVLFVKPQDQESLESLIPRGKRFQYKVVSADIPWHSFNEQLKFYLLLNEENVDLMHFPYISIPILYKRPFVVTIHDLIVHHFSTGKATTLPPLFYQIKRLGYDQVIKHATTSSQKIIVPLNATKQDLINTLHIPSEKIEITGEGFDPHLKITNESESYVKNLLKDSKYFLYVGNAYPHKNLERLSTAFLKFNIENKLKFVLVGREDAFYKKLKNDFKDTSILYLHDVNDDRLASLYAHAISLVAPSLIEGFGLPVLEAMSLSCLVVASSIAAHKEVCQDAALFFNPEDIEEIIKVLEKALSLEDSEKSWHIKRGLVQASMFSWKSMVEKTISIYEGRSSTLSSRLNSE